MNQLHKGQLLQYTIAICSDLLDVGELSMKAQYKLEYKES